MVLWNVVITQMSTDSPNLMLKQDKLRAMKYIVMAGCTWDAVELAVVEHKHTFHGDIVDVHVMRSKKDVIFFKEF